MTYLIIPIIACLLLMGLLGVAAVVRSMQITSELRRRAEHENQ